jgi:hypothetical protein
MRAVIRPMEKLERRGNQPVRPLSCVSLSPASCNDFNVLVGLVTLTQYALSFFSLSSFSSLLRSCLISQVLSTDLSTNTVQPPPSSLEFRDNSQPGKMSTQAALIAETIVGMKKALRRENECELCIH